MSLAIYSLELLRSVSFQELDEVKWEFEVRDYQVGQSQETWSTRLERLERENMQLHAALQRTQTQLKYAKRENTSD